MRRILMLLVVAVVALSAGALSLLAQEAPAYIIAKVTVTDPDGYAQYGAGFNRVFGQYEGEIVAFSEDPTILEGEWSATRTVIIRFPSKASASNGTSLTDTRHWSRFGSRLRQEMSS